MRVSGLIVAVILLVYSAGVAAQQQTVVGGPGNDYQVTVIQPWSQPEQRIAVFERLNGAFSGDLWLTRSSDAGSSWDAPSVLVNAALNERHANLVQTSAQAFSLFYLSNASGSFRIVRATSSDGSTFTAGSALNLGWISGGEINPQVIRDPDGTLTLAYHRVNGPAYIARSNDEGASWDALKTQVSPSTAALPRLARRDSDGLYLLTYQTGSSPVTIWVKSSLDPYDWSAPAVQVAVDGNNHDPWPLVMPDGRLVVVWARVVDAAFQLHSNHSDDGVFWSAPQLHNPRAGLNNVQPMALPSPIGGRVEVYWGGAQLPGDSNYDILRLPQLLVVDPIFASGM